MTRVSSSQGSKPQSLQAAKASPKPAVIQLRGQTGRLQTWRLNAGPAVGASTRSQGAEASLEQLASLMLGTKVAKKAISRSVRESVARETSLQSRDEQAFWSEVRSHALLQSYSSSQIAGGIKAYLAKRGPLAMPEMLFHETPAEMAKTIAVWIEHLVKNEPRSLSKTKATKAARSKAKAARKSA